AWGDELLDRLPPRAKARFKGGRFSGVEDGKAIFALPNEIHRDRCGDFKAEVEDVLAAHFGRPVPLALVVDEGGAATPAAAAGPTDGTPAATNGAGDAAPDDDEVIDVTELEDAVGQDQSAVARLAETFGDVEVIEEES
ncbi:MAG TPA: hypothetical protein VD926_13800, partial [Acidimicrobiales bacterium]|nr:hypothetical protein [Acidimicrobiales bacterium]